MEIVRALRAYVSSEIEGVLKDALSPVAPYLRTLSIGSVLVIVSAVAFSLSLLFSGGALFFMISHFEDLAVAAVWSAVFFLVVGCAFVAAGFRLIRKPRQ